MRFRSIRTSVAAALVLMTGAAGMTAAVHAATLAASSAACGGNTAYAGGGWTAIKVPSLSTIAIERTVTYAPDRLYASDGQGKLLRSDDDGCSWQDISPVAPTVAGTGAVAEAVSIAAISAPSSSTSASYLYIGANIRPTNSLPVSLPSQPYVYVSNIAGRTTFVANSGQGLPPVGTITDIAAADLAPRTVYAMISNAGSNSGLWASGDAGNSWHQPGSTDTTLTNLRVDPTVANHIYAIKPGVGLVLSVDGGRTFDPTARTATDVSSFSAIAGSGSLQLAQGHTSAGYADFTLDAGRTWRTVLFPAQKASNVAVAPEVPVMTAYDDQHMTVAQLNTPGTLLLPLTPGIGTPRDNSVQLTATTSVGMSITGVSRDNQRILRAIYNPLIRKIRPPSLTPIRLLPQVTVKQFPSVLTGDATTVTLPAGGRQDVDYKLLLPRTPSPVDLMFLVDTTQSTDQMIDGVRQGLTTVVNELASTGLDAQFGVGEFRDYPGAASGGGDDTDFPYKLRRRIGPVNLALQTALGGLRSDGGGDVAEDDLAALYYSTTGAGERLGRRVLVRAGGEAGYRPSSLRLAVLATDEAFHRESDYPGPHWNATVAALNAAGVHQIGLAVQSTDSKGNPAPGLFDSVPDQTAMAFATHAIAPRGGVDCDGDGITDVDQGGALVCTVSKQADNRVVVQVPNGGPGVTVGSPPPPVHLAPLVVQLAESIPDYRAVTLAVTGPAPAGSAQTVSPRSAPTVNIRTDNSLGFVVRYTCPKAAKPHSWPLTLTAKAGARAITSTSATLVCGPTAPPPLPPPAAAVTLAAGVAPGAPPNPPTNFNGNANPNPAVNPNAGFAQQDDQQPQLALAESDQGLEDAEGQQLAMSRRTTETERTALMLGAAGLMTAAAAGYATRRRWRSATQPW